TSPPRRVRGGRRRAWAEAGGGRSGAGRDHMSPTRRSAEAPLTDGDFRSLAEFRHALREFLAFSEEAARGAGITPHHHQLLLAVRGYPGPAQPSMSDIAEWLHLKLHSAGELVARAEAAGLVERVADPSDARRVLLAVSTAG